MKLNEAVREMRDSEDPRIKMWAEAIMEYVVLGGEAAVILTDKIMGLQDEVERWKKQATEYREFLDAANQRLSDERAKVRAVVAEMDSGAYRSGAELRASVVIWQSTLREIGGKE